MGGAHCEHVETVCDFWRYAARRTIDIGLKDCYAYQVVRNSCGRAVLRFKDTMRGTLWYPVGRSADDLEFAQQMLYDKDDVDPSKFQFAVPNVLPIRKLRQSAEQLRPRLSRYRSIVRFPTEAVGAAYEWWTTFCDKEDDRMESMC